MGSNHAWAASATWVGTAFSFLGFLEKTSWNFVLGKVVATCFSFETSQSCWAQGSHSLSLSCHDDKCSLSLLTFWFSVLFSLNEFEIF